MNSRASTKQRSPVIWVWSNQGHDFAEKVSIPTYFQMWQMETRLQDKQSIFVIMLTL